MQDAMQVGDFYKNKLLFFHLPFKIAKYQSLSLQTVLFRETNIEDQTTRP